jgi:hypothetical protein
LAAQVLAQLILDCLIERYLALRELDANVFVELPREKHFPAHPVEIVVLRKIAQGRCSVYLAVVPQNVETLML